MNFFFKIKLIGNISFFSSVWVWVHAGAFMCGHVCVDAFVRAMADLHQNFLGSQNNILKIYIFNIVVTNSIKIIHNLLYL